MQALRLSLEIGAAMMESGGEVRRTEDTVTRINYAAGATDAQVWAVPGILTATVILADNTTHTGTKRLGPEEIDLAELDRLNTLSRRLCRGETVDWTVTKRRIYSRRTRLLCTFLATAAFCIYFGGTWAEAVLCGGFGILVSGYRPALQSGSSRSTGVYAAGTGTAPTGRQHTHWHHYVAGARADGGQRAARYD